MSSTRINPTVNQSSTAGYTAFLINPTETATGSGAKLLADFIDIDNKAHKIGFSNGRFAVPHNSLYIERSVVKERMMGALPDYMPVQARTEIEQSLTKALEDI